MTATRRAEVTGTSRGSALADTVTAYLPTNYRVVGHVRPGVVGIEGTDVAGWTLDDYVIPRLASGLMWATEVAGWNDSVLPFPTTG